MRCLRGWVLLLVAGFLFATPAWADRFGRGYGHGRRDGFVVGFGVGFGSAFPCDVCPNFAANFQIGAMATPEVAVVADFSAVGGDGDGDDDGIGVAAIGIQVWPNDRVWFKLGVGVGATIRSNEWDDDWDASSDRSWAGIAGLGFDIVRNRDFALDLWVRGAFIRDHQSVAVGIGLNWY